MLTTINLKQKTEVVKPFLAFTSVFLFGGCATAPLRVSPLALSDGGNGPANDILEQLFWLDEEQPGVIKLVPTERGTARYNANPNFALHYDDNDNWPPRSPVAMWFDDTILDDFLKDWAAVQKKLYAGEITQAEYFEWKIMWPE